MKDYFRAIFIRPGEDPKIGTQRNTLRALQERVGGHIETATITDRMVVICNEEGLINGMRHSATICGLQFFGPIIVAGVDGEEFTDVPEEEFAELYGRRKL